MLPAINNQPCSCVHTQSADAEEAQAVSSGKRKRQAEAKPLRSQLVIEQAHKARPVPLPPPRRKVSATQHAAQAMTTCMPEDANACRPLAVGHVPGWGNAGSMGRGPWRACMSTQHRCAPAGRPHGAHALPCTRPGWRHAVHAAQYGAPMPCHDGPALTARLACRCVRAQPGAPAAKAAAQQQPAQQAVAKVKRQRQQGAWRAAWRTYAVCVGWHSGASPLGFPASCQPACAPSCRRVA